MDSSYVPRSEVKARSTDGSYHRSSPVETATTFLAVHWRNGFAETRSPNPGVATWSTSPVMEAAGMRNVIRTPSSRSGSRRATGSSRRTLP